MSDERAWHRLKENEAILKKIKNFTQNYQKITYLHRMPTPRVPALATITSATAACSGGEKL